VSQHVGCGLSIDVHDYRRPGLEPGPTIRGSCF
jgi:hypothetical protein